MPLHNKCYVCNCGKNFKHASSLWNHKKKCRIIPADDINTIPPENPFMNQSQPDFVTTMMQLIKQNQEFKEMIMELTNVEINVLLVALDHMEEEISDLMSERTLRGDMWKERLDACESIRTKIKQVC